MIFEAAAVAGALDFVLSLLHPEPRATVKPASNDVDDEIGLVTHYQILAGESIPKVDPKRYGTLYVGRDEPLCCVVIEHF